MKEELHVVLVESTVNEFLVKLCTESTCSEGLSLTTSEDSRTVRTWKRFSLAPDRTDLCSLTTIETSTLVEDAATHSVLLYIVIVTVDESILLCKFILRKLSVSCCVCFLIVFANLLKCFCTSMLLESLLCYVVSWLVALSINVSLEFVIINFVAIFALNISAEFLHEFLLDAALWLDSLVCCLESFEKILLRHFLHLTLNHHDVLLCSTYHKVHISVLQLLESWVDNKLAIDASYANLRDRTLEWDIRCCECCRSSETCKSIRHIDTISREEVDIHINLCMVV